MDHLRFVLLKRDGATSPLPSKRNYTRQGVPYPLQDSMRVLDPETMQPVPNDGETMGEIMFRGNIVMKGYLKIQRQLRKLLQVAGSTLET